MFANTDLANTAALNIFQSATEASIRSIALGTSTLTPLTFHTGNSERLRLDTSGNLLVGATSADARLSAHATNLTIPAISARYSAAGYKMGFGVYNVLGYPYLALNCNQVASSNNQTYDLSAFASKLDLAIDNISGGFVFSTAASGTAGNTITWSERMRIDGSSGNVGIGGTANSYAKVEILGNLPSITTSIAAEVSGTFPSATTSNGYGFRSFINTIAASFTLANLRHFGAIQGTIGAGSTVTNQYGFWVSSNLTGATNNYGFYSDIASGSNRWNFYAAGTADNFFAGRVFFTSTNATPATSNVEGMAWTTSKNLQVSCEGDPLLVNRKGTDGALVNFYQDGTIEGNISVSGNTVSYNPFMGSHYTEIAGAIPTLKGTVLESLDELVDGKYSNQDRLPKAKVSDTAGSSAVYGVYFAPDSDPDTNDGILAAALGASWVRIAAGVTVQRGDLLESNGDGCAKVQSDDIIRSKTIGKVTSTTVADTYPDGSYIVPCVLYCG